MSERGAWVPSSRLWAALALLALPTVAAGFWPSLRWGVLGLDSLLLTLAAADALWTRRVALEVERDPVPKLSVGARTDVRLAVRAQAPFGAVTVRLKDTAPEPFAATPAELRVAVPPGTRVRATYQVLPPARGQYAWGDVYARVRGPLGWVWQERRLRQATQVSVYPDLRGARELALERARSLPAQLGLRRLRRDGQGSEFARLRDYAQGDSVRDVDWKATARRLRPVTRVLEAERAQYIWLCVDTGRTMATQLDGLTRLDHCVNAALLLAHVALRQQDRVGLVLFADEVKALVPPAAGAAQYRRIVDALYRARAEPAYVDYDALFARLGHHLRRRSLLCLFTDVPDEEQAAELLRPLRVLARRHLPVCLAVEESGLVELLCTEPREPGAAYQQAVAAELLLERERTHERLRREGLPLVEVQPEALSVAAVNHYLSVKSRGAL